MTEPNFGFDGARTEIELERWAAQVAAKAERYQDMQQQVTAVTATESSKDGIVTVTVDSGGTVLDLRITDQSRSLPGAEIAELVLATMRRAQSRITEQVSQIMRETVGEDPQTVDAVVSSYQQRFPEPPPEAPTPSTVREYQIGQVDDDDPGPARRPPRRPRPPQRDDDDDWGDGPFLR